MWAEVTSSKAEHISIRSTLKNHIEYPDCRAPTASQLSLVWLELMTDVQPCESTL